MNQDLQMLNNRFLLHSLPRIEQVFNDEYKVNHEHVIVISDTIDDFEIEKLVNKTNFKSIKLVSIDEFRTMEIVENLDSCLIIKIKRVSTNITDDFPFYISFSTSYQFLGTLIGVYIPTIQRNEQGFSFGEPKSISISEFD